MADLNEQQFGAYRMQHRPAAPGDDTGSPMHDLSGTFPDDVYQHPNWYTGQDSGEMRQQINRARGKPDASVRMYRALPKPHREINPGDWVTPSLDYAKQHARSSPDPAGMHVVVTWAPAKHFYSPGDDLQEWGYQGEEAKRGEVIWRGRRRTPRVE